jgi:PEP-CTERM motif
VEPYANAEFYARAWIGAVTWEKAVEQSSAFIGMSPVFEDKTGSWGMAPGGPNSSPLYHFPSFTIMPVPEPGTMALLALGGFFVLASIMGNRRH